MSESRCNVFSVIMTMPVCLSVCVCALTGQQLDDGGENESFPLLELEELKDEDKEADAA